MSVAATRKTVGTSPSVLAENTAVGAGADFQTRSYLLIPQVAAGVVILGPPNGGGTLTAANGARWDLSIFPQPMSVDLEPGEQLMAMVASGSIAIDVLSAGR